MRKLYGLISTLQSKLTLRPELERQSSIRYSSLDQQTYSIRRTSQKGGPNSAKTAKRSYLTSYLRRQRKSSPPSFKHMRTKWNADTLRASPTSRPTNTPTTFTNSATRRNEWVSTATLRCQHAHTMTRCRGQGSTSRVRFPTSDQAAIPRSNRDT